MFRVQSPSPNIENVLTLWNVIISSDYHSFLLRHCSKSMTIFKNCPIFSPVFCVFLNNEWSIWYYLYIYVKLCKGATTFVNRVKHVAVFLVPWEFWPKREIGGSFILFIYIFHKSFCTRIKGSIMCIPYLREQHFYERAYLLVEVERKEQETPSLPFNNPC